MVATEMYARGADSPNGIGTLAESPIGTGTLADSPIGALADSPTGTVADSPMADSPLVATTDASEPLAQLSRPAEALDEPQKPTSPHSPMAEYMLSLIHI